MPRELSNAPCELTFDDRISGDKITLFHDLPTTEDRVKYTNGYVTRQGNKVVSSLGELRMKAGSKVFRGFKTGAFSVPGKGLISSTPGEPNYASDWKALVKQYAPDFIEMLAIHVFEAPMMRIGKPNVNAPDILSSAIDDWSEAPAQISTATGAETNVAEDKDESPLKPT